MVSLSTHRDRTIAIQSGGKDRETNDDGPPFQNTASVLPFKIFYTASLALPSNKNKNPGPHIGPVLGKILKTGPFINEYAVSGNHSV